MLSQLIVVFRLSGLATSSGACIEDVADRVFLFFEDDFELDAVKFLIRQQMHRRFIVKLAIALCGSAVQPYVSTSF